MSSKRKSFVLHNDSLDILDDLDDQQVGLLFRAIKSYQRDEDINLSGMVKIAFSPFKNQFIRDDTKYAETCERRAISGSKGGKQKVANASKCKQKVANLADSVSKSKNDSKSDSDSNKEVTNDRFAEFWNMYGKKVDSAKCKNKFSKLTKNEIDLIFKNLPMYIESKPDVQFRKNPITWLNGKCWNDEVIYERQNNANHSIAGKKESSHERIKRENAIKYGQPDECGLVVGADDGHLGRTMDARERIRTIEHMDNRTFIDYE